MPPYGLTGVGLPLWDPLDIILYNLVGKYRPRYEGDRMLVELVDVTLDASEADKFLASERGTLSRIPKGENRNVFFFLARPWRYPSYS